MTEQLHPDAVYIATDPFSDQDCTIECRVVRIVTVRKDQSCFEGLNPSGGDKHVIHRGERARLETALIDSDFWGRYYTCLPCLDAWIADASDTGDDDL
jgi:hypothetical protein